MNSSQPWTVLVGVFAGFVRITSPHWSGSRLALAIALGAMGLFWMRYIRKALHRRKPAVDHCRLCAQQKTGLALCADGMLLCPECMEQWKQREAEVEMNRKAAELWEPAYPAVYVPAKRSEPGACCDDGWGIVAATAK